MSKLYINLSLTLMVATTVFTVVNQSSLWAAQPDSSLFDKARPKIPFKPRRYICYKIEKLTIDGNLLDDGWLNTIWTEDFVDIEGELKPKPHFRTRVKMLWDDEYLYIAAEIEEPDIWATLTERDAVIYQDNDFEVFLDPDGDTHNYYELELNAFGTVWDLMLLKPYRDGGPAINGWDLRGLKVAVEIDGTINNPSDKDSKWTVEIAMPWKILQETAPGNRPPKNGEQWRINFSRVEWRVNVKDGKYQKEINPETGKPFPEANWVWSPQGEINMHLPERWGYIQLSDIVAGKGTDEFWEDANEEVKWALRQLYLRQKLFYEANGHYATDPKQLKADDIIVEGLDFVPSIQVTASSYEITVGGFNGKTIHLRDDGRVW